MELKKDLVSIPTLYMEEESIQKGTVERIDYHTVDLQGNDMAKYAFVYVPYGYDPAREYEIMYLIHGGGENAEKYLYQGGEENPLKRSVDHLIANKEIKPTLIVTPSWYFHNDMKSKTGKEGMMHFPTELVNDLMPAVESRYHTFAKTAGNKGFKESRNHRSVIGWSMGSVTTWYIFSECIDYFDRFGNMSGDMELEGSFSFTDPEPGKTAEEDVRHMAEKIREQKRALSDYSIYYVTGTKDFMYPRIAPQVKAMEKYPDVFDLNEGGNLSFILCEDGEHHTPWRLQYTYNLIKNYL